MVGNSYGVDLTYGSRLMGMPLVKNNKNLKVLNMTELTPLAAEMPFELERGSYYPLWFHKGVEQYVFKR